MQRIYPAYFQSPLGILELLSDGQNLLAVNFVKKIKKSKTTHPLLRLGLQQLREYFSGRRQSFSLPLLLDGTVWQNKVWLKLSQVPYGAVISYRDLARAVGSPDGSRAVGQTVGANRLAIIIPCHRVLGTGGRLGGYSGGLAKKQWLLAHEGHGDLF